MLFFSIQDSAYDKILNMNCEAPKRNVQQTFEQQ